jgi:hypothetical protein
MPSQIETYLEKKRDIIQRIDPSTANERIGRKDGTTIIDTRPESFRKAEGYIPGALIIERYTSPSSNVSQILMTVGMCWNGVWIPLLQIVLNKPVNLDLHLLL